MTTFFQGKVVYHVCDSREVSRYLHEGMTRTKGRHYVFEDWAHVQMYLSSLLPDISSPIDIKQYAVLVLGVDRDMLLPDPISGSNSSLRLDETERQEIDSNSHYLEVDLNPERITDVKDPFGNSIIERFHERENRRTPVWRFLAYLKPYWPFVVLATIAGIFKFL
ncbi:MAG: hypothetical protein R3351_04425, partial [Nitrospirales bacterium]|nr:hypothetical protein [Nitrospirales bacterium]